jgi:hypothetical protein
MALNDSAEPLQLEHIPTDAYRHPDGGFVVEKKYVVGDEIYTVSSLRRDPPDLKLLARTFLETAITIGERERMSSEGGDSLGDPQVSR